MIEFLLPLVGRKILVIFALSIVRTTLSNRLAKIQVRSELFFSAPMACMDEFHACTLGSSNLSLRRSNFLAHLV